MSDDPDNELQELIRANDEAKNFVCTVEVRPSEMSDTISEFSWAVTITTAAGSRDFVIGGEPYGPFMAIQRAIDKYAFGVEDTRRLSE